MDMTGKERLLMEWTAELSIMHIAHHKAASFYSQCHLSLGIAAVFVSALLGASVGELIFGKDEFGRILTTILGITGAIFAGIQTFLGAEGRSNKHHASAATFGEIRRELEQLASFPEPADLNERLIELRKKWNFALQAAPNLPAFIHDPVQLDFRARDKEHIDA